MNAFYYLPILLFSVLFTLLYYKGRIFHGTNSVHGATRKYQAVTGTLFVLSIIFYTFPDQVCTAQTGVNYAAMFKTTSYDFQSVLRNSKAEYQFEFVNQSTRPVHISQAVSSCGCTSVVVETPTVQPGATGTIRAILNTRQFSGQRRVTLTVSFDRPAWGQVQLQIRGYIRNDMELSPRSVQFRVNDDSPEVMEQKAYISQPWTRTKLESARSSCSFLSAKLEAPQYRGKELIYPITLSMKTADVPNGYFKERISVYGSDARNALLVFDVEGVSLSKITASPGTVFFLKLPEKRDNMRKVVVAGQRPFTIKEISCPNPAFMVDESAIHTEEPQRIYILPVYYLPEQGTDQGTIRSTIEIKTDKARCQFNVLAETGTSDTDEAENPDTIKIE